MDKNKARKGCETSGESNIAVVNAGGVVPVAVVLELFFLLI